MAPWVAGPETIVFHHGIGGSLGLWAGWIPQLVDRYRLVMFDMRGCGRSHIPDDDFAWSLDQMARDVFAVADAAGVARFHLVGELIGGTAALAAVLAEPARIATLTVSNGAHVGTTLGRVQAWRSTIDEQGIKHWSDIFMHDRFHEGALTAEQWAWFAAQQQAWPRASILNALGVLVGTDLSARGWVKYAARPCCCTPTAARSFRCRSWPSCIGCCPMRGCVWSSIRAMACLFPMPGFARPLCGLSSTSMAQADNELRKVLQ